MRCDGSATSRRQLRLCELSFARHQNKVRFGQQFVDLFSAVNVAHPDMYAVER